MLPSLRASLLLWLLLPLVAFGFVTGCISHESTQRTASLLQDDALLLSARTIMSEVVKDHVVRTKTIPSAGLASIALPDSDRLFCKVVVDGKPLAGGTPDLAGPPDTTHVPMVYNTSLGNTLIRAVSYEREVFNSGEVKHVIVVVGATKESQRAMLESLWRPLLLRQSAMLSLVAVFVLIGLTIELRPLMELKGHVVDREPTYLEPIRVDRLPSELSPIAEAINQCVARLQIGATTQRRFVTGVAHRLRAPLTLLGIQTQCALCESGDLTVAETLATIRCTSREMVHITNQMLLLAQAESMRLQSRVTQVDLGNMVSSVLEEMIVAAQLRNIDLGAELDEGVHVMGNSGLLKALVTNLVDNALRYTQEHGWVTAICRREVDEVVLVVIDNGPGIPAEVHSRIFEHFDRAAREVEGAGLGFAIVRQIALAHRGKVEVASGVGRVGFAVTVRLPA